MVINFILGAGFSRPAGYPLAHQINSSLCNVKNRILKMSSSEWMWDDYDEVTTHNGSLSPDVLKYSYLLHDLTNHFKKEGGGIFDYEKFYDWFQGIYGDKTILIEYTKIVDEQLIEKYAFDIDSIHLFGNVGVNEWRVLNEICNYLIEDLLKRPYERKTTIESYHPFIKVVETADETNIFSLNHDLLAEYLFEHHGINFSDGFTTDKSVIVGEGNERLPIFQNEYSDPVSLYKLHGSIDYFVYDEGNEHGARVTPTGNYWYFKPLTYYNKHSARRVDQHGEIIQSFPPTTLYPQFLTGKNKSSIIESNKVYKPMFDTFRESLKDSDYVIIIGYSYGDEHVNEILRESLSGGKFKLINVNPGIDFPFMDLYKPELVTQLKSIEDLNLS